MKNPLLPILSLTLSLFAAGCTDSDWNHLLSYGGMGSSGEEAVAPVQPAAEAPAATAAAEPAAPTQPANADFCRNVATEDATRNGFDQATQQQVFQRSFAQCVAIYTR
ncbi:MAG TPA: hypothetical protein VFA87_03660 [Rhizomicrobium sp.]|nr:hypothetical protein [Rhizomicrobium sp.]